MKKPPSYCIARYDKEGNRWIVGGCGRNRGTLAYAHSKRRARHWAKKLNEANPSDPQRFIYKVEEI